MTTTAPTLPVLHHARRAWALTASWARGLVVLAVLLTFADVCRHEFVPWDDDYTLEHNDRIQQPSVQNLLYYWRRPYMDLYVPVTYTAWMALACISRAIAGGRLDARVFHTASVLVHAANALLVFDLLQRLLKRPWPAAAGALLFALHPVQVESVAWTSGLKDLLCGTFSLLALGQYVRSVAPAGPEETAPSAGRRRLRYALGMAAMLAGMLCKPTAMVTPMLAAIVDLLVLRRSWRRVALSVAPWFALAIPCIVWTRLCQPPGYLRPTTLWTRPLIAADALAFYLFKLAVPIKLSFDYGRTPWTAIDSHWAYFSWQLPAVAAAVLFYYRRRVQPLIAAALLLVAGVAPVLGFSVFDFQMVSTVADHYLYLAMLGPALACAWGLTRFPAGLRWPAIAVAAALALLAIRTVDQARYWRDGRALFFHGLEVNAQSWCSYYGLAYICHVEGRALAAEATKKAALGPSPAASADRAAADELLRDALAFYRKTLALNPNNLLAYHGYGGVMLYFGMYPQAAKAFAEVVIRQRSVPPGARSRFAEDYDFLGQCLYLTGKPDAAIAAFRAALQLEAPPPKASQHLKVVEAALAAAKKPSAVGPAITDTSHETADNGK